MRTLARLLILVPLAIAMPYACSDDHDEEPAPAGYDDVVYEGEVTDEALTSLVAALDQKAPTTSASQAATLDMPATGTLSKATITTFAWHIGTTTRLEPRAPELLPAPSRERWYGPLRDLIGPERAAHAHGTPYTGTATWLVFSTASDPKLVRVLTSATTYTPTQAVWDKMAAAGGPITLDLVTAVFADNRVATDGGPFQGSKFEFTITP